MVSVVVLAGGKGTRMQSSLPKVLHCVQGVPMIVRVVVEALKLRPSTVLVVVGEDTRGPIEAALAPFAECVTLVTQYDPAGTGHAVQACLPELGKEGDSNDSVLVLSGDVPNVQASTLCAFIDSFELRPNANDASFVATTVSDPTGYGRVMADGRIVEEKDCVSQEERDVCLVNGGVYVFRRDFLLAQLPGLSNEGNAQHEYYLTDLLKAPLVPFVLPSAKQSEIMGVNTQAQLAEAEFQAAAAAGH
jgi:bifunctional N-acetylglucosamine-1-phosphate-uridyltransferase/glucosamine-1-phosphate-acetyltransferase GlmU-like protein